MNDLKRPYVAFDTGCIECGEESALIGTFATEAEAQAACDAWEAVGWRGGQHYYEVFDLRNPAGLPPAQNDHSEMTES